MKYIIILILAFLAACISSKPTGGSRPADADNGFKAIILDTAEGSFGAIGEPYKTIRYNTGVFIKDSTIGDSADLGERFPPSYQQPFGDVGNRFLKEQMKTLALFTRIDSLEARIKVLEERPYLLILPAGDTVRNVWLMHPDGHYSLLIKQFNY
jgi:hypothetical protein